MLTAGNGIAGQSGKKPASGNVFWAAKGELLPWTMSFSLVASGSLIQVLIASMVRIRQVQRAAKARSDQKKPSRRFLGKWLRKFALASLGLNKACS